LGRKRDASVDGIIVGQRCANIGCIIDRECLYTQYFRQKMTTHVQSILGWMVGFLKAETEVSI